MSLSQDMIVGFCGETEEDHQDTLALMEYVKYDFGFMFTYSERPGTLAGNKMEDDVPEAVKNVVCKKSSTYNKNTLYQNSSNI